MINKLFCENNIHTMCRMSNNFIDGIITSPPYNISTKRKDCYYNNGYSYIDNLTEDEYLKIRLDEFKYFDKILKNDGVICYNISYHKDNPILPILLLKKVHDETDLTLADIISWKKTNSIPFQTSPNKLSRLIELIYVIVHKDFLNTYKANKEISKINEKTGQKFYKNYVNFIEAPNNDKLKSKLKAAFSEKLVYELLNIYFEEGSLIYDPFSGLGTTARSCLKNNRNFIGSEIDKEIYEDSLKYLKK